MYVLELDSLFKMLLVFELKSPCNVSGMNI